jgi:endoglucanase
MWKQIAIHFRNYGDHVIFAGMNEVSVNNFYGTPTKEYITVDNSFAQTFVSTVRATGGRNYYRYLAVQGYATNIDNTVDYFVVPADVNPNRLMVEVHYYDPYDFTLNGKPNIIEWGKYATAPSETETWANEAYADSQFLQLQKTYINNGTAVFVGEYGVEARLNLNSSFLDTVFGRFRRYYMAYITKSIVNHGMCPFYWDNGGIGNLGCGLFNRNTGVRAYTDILNAIMDTITTINPNDPQTGVQTLIDNKSISVFPNPATSTVTIKNNHPDLFKIQIINVTGSIVRELQNCQYSVSINISDVPNGIYVVQVLGASSSFFGKLVKN